MMRLSAVITVVGIGEPELRDWIARGWVAPEPATPPEDFAFADIDVARVRLIRDLRRGMGVDLDSVPLVLGLIDQVHALRRTLRAVSTALDAEPEATRQRVWTAIRD